jgi:hypothetical protein
MVKLVSRRVHPHAHLLSQHGPILEQRACEGLGDDGNDFAALDVVRGDPASIAELRVEDAEVPDTHACNLRTGR